MSRGNFTKMSENRFVNFKETLRKFEKPYENCGKTGKICKIVYKSFEKF